MSEVFVVGLCWVWLGWVGSGLFGLGWIGLVCVMLGWINLGLGWVELGLVHFWWGWVFGVVCIWVELVDVGLGFELSWTGLGFGTIRV